MKKMFLLFILAAVLVSSGCVNQENDTGNDDAGVQVQEQGMSIADVPLSDDIDKVEVLHFHGHNQCYSCVTLGDFAEETMNTYFAEELESGDVVFAHVNGELPGNSALVQKYGATGSSLWIGVYRNDGSFSKEQNTNVWYKINDKEGFMDYLRGVIEEKLGGG